MTLGEGWESYRQSVLDDPGASESSLEYAFYGGGSWMLIMLMRIFMDNDNRAEEIQAALRKVFLEVMMYRKLTGKET